MCYSITANAQFNSLEITFDSKPSAAVRDALKALRFRWHGIKKCWYGYADEGAVRAAIDGQPAPDPAETIKTAAPASNVYGVQVGDIFSASWGYDQTNVDFFQVVQLVGTQSVRVREVHPPMVQEDPVSGMSSNRIYKMTRDLLRPCPSSVFIKDQEHGDLKRVRGDTEGRPKFRLDTFADAYLCTGETVRTYESWYR